MEYLAVCSNEAIAPMSPVYVDETPHANPLYAHIVNVSSKASKTFLGIAISGVRKGDMSSVLVSGLFKIPNSTANKEMYTFDDPHWIKTNNDEKTIVGSVVHTIKDVDEDGEVNMHVVSIMPWANYLSIEPKSTAGEFSQIKADFADECIAEVQKSKQVTVEIIRNALENQFDALLATVLAKAQFKWK